MKTSPFERIAEPSVAVFPLAEAVIVALVLGSELIVAVPELPFPNGIPGTTQSNL
jgi:hypothetical protein